ncbi:MAG: hypothetical protein ACJ72L_06060 [Marmoricola sp.]
MRSLWITPALAALLLLLTAPQISLNTRTTMVMSSAAATAVLIWAPTQVLLSYTSVRQMALSRDDPLPAPLSRKSRLLRTASVLAAPLLWGATGWLAYWAGAATLAHRLGGSLYLSMSLNGLALSVIAVVVGAVLAVHGSRPWVAALAAGGLWFSLAVWSYVPDTAASILLQPYDPLFLVGSLPNHARLAVQCVWAVVVLAAGIAWLGRIAGGVLVAGACSAAALAVVWAGTTAPLVLPRAGRLSMHCVARSGIEVCLWSDHEGARASYERGVDLALEVAGAPHLAPALREGDILRPPPGTIPPDARAAAITKTSNDPDLNEIVAALVAPGFRRPSTCPPSAGVDGPGASGLVEGVISTRTSPRDGRHLSWSDIRTWLAGLRLDVAACRPPTVP